MRMNLKCCVLLLMAVTTVMPTAAMQAAETDSESQLMQAWEHDFNWYLLDHKDPNLQAYGLFALTTFGGPQAVSVLHGKALLDYERAHAALLADQGLNAPSMFLLLTVCQNGKDVAGCDYFQLAENLMRLHSENMASYLFSLSMAAQHDDEGDLVALVRAMADAAFINEHLHVTAGFESVLRSYATEQPIPDMGFELVTKMPLAVEPSSAAEMKSVKEQINARRMFMYINSINLSLPVSPYQPLIEACKNYQELSDDCLSISKVFIQSGQWLPVAIGHSMQVNLFASRGDVKAHEQALKRKAALKEYTACLSQISNMPALHQLNLDHAWQRMQNTREQGELAAMYHYAKVKYQEGLASGHADAELRNPDMCAGKDMYLASVKSSDHGQ